jgi:predicted Rossmann-fold nucleotide-binding protein
MKTIPIVLVSKYYWNRAINFAFLQEEGVVGHADLDIFKIVDNADEAWSHIVNWYKNKGEALFDD